MLKHLITALFILSGLVCFPTDYVWNGTTNTDWGTSTNWTPNGVPGASDDIEIDNQSNNPVLDQARSVNNIDMSSGTLDLGGFTLSCGGGTYAMDGGTISNGTLAFSGSTTTFSGTKYDCKVTVTSSNVYLNGSAFYDSLLVEKTGAGQNYSNGGNVFNDYFSFTNSGSGIVRLADVTGDSVKSKVFFHSSGSEKIHVAYDGTNVFQDSILINSTGSSSGVRFCQGTGTATLDANKGIAIGSSGFSTGRFHLKNFTKNGTNSMSLTFTGDADIRFESGTTINGDLTITSPNVYLNGATFNNALTITKNGSTDNYSDGGNTFKGATQITNSGSGKLRLADDSNDDFQSTVTFTCASGDYIDVARDNSTTFSDNVVVECTGTGDGIRFGNGSGTSTLASGKTLTISGDFVGELLIKGFTQTGSTAQTLTQTGVGNIKLSTGTTFNGNLIVNAVNLYFDGATFNGTVDATKTTAASGSVNNNSEGGNTFNGRAEFTNESGKLFLLANNSGDDFNATAKFVQASSGVMKPANDGVNTFSGDSIIANNTYNSNIIEFTEGKGQVSLDKSGSQVISGNLAELEFDTLKLSDGSGTVTLDTDIEIQYSTSALLLGARILDLNSNKCTFRNEATTAITYSTGMIQAEDSDGSSQIIWDINSTTGAHIIPFGNNSSVQIPFTFNLTAGDAGSLTIYTYPCNDAKSPKPSGVSNFTKDSEDATDDFINRFWEIDLSGASSPTVTATFTYADADLPPNGEDDGFEAQRWGGSAWDSPLGSQSASTANNTVEVPGISSFSPWSLSKVPVVPLPVELLYFDVSLKGNDTHIAWETGAELDNDYFELYHSEDGVNFKPIHKVHGQGTYDGSTAYSFLHKNVVSGVHYYRLKQVDHDGSYTWTETLKVKVENAIRNIGIYSSVLNSFDEIQLIGASNKARFMVYDMNGKLVYYSSSRHILNINAPKGYYNLTVIDSPNVANFRLYIR